MKITLVLIICFPFCFFSQNSSFWISFTDKNNSPYSVNQPSQFLSQKSIERRVNAGISILANDLPVNETYVDSILVSGNFQLLQASKWLNAIAIITDDTASLNTVLNYSFVSNVVQVKSLKQDKIIDKFEDISITKNEINLLSIPHYPYGYSYNQLALHAIDKMQDLGFRGQGIDIAIIDAGFFRANELHALEDVFNEGRILSTRDFVNGGESVYEDHQHGTMVLSVIAGSIDGEFKGAAPLANFHLLRSEDVGSETLLEEYNWIAAAEYADSVGADIINTSLGYTTFDDSLQNHTYADLDGNTTVIAKAADIAAAKGILLCISAGNSGASAWQYISTPADADSVLAVAAVDSNGTYAFFSSVGPSADNDIKPNVASVGWNTYLIAPFTGEVMRGNGTSFSAPMMTGMAACLWQSLPNKTNMEIMELIEQSSSQYSNPDSLLGYGLPNVFDAYNKETGVVYVPPKEDIIEDVFPVPVTNLVNIIFVSNISQGIVIRIYSEKGDVVVSVSETVSQGKNQLVLSQLKSLPAGSYIVEIESGQGSRATATIVVI
ncbi:MAG: S8 family serine peptidase [Flavobacteriales bacterium]|nr:S8 family serine peptidase [Flavobacteriales bacterium]